MSEREPTVTIRHEESGFNLQIPETLWDSQEDDLTGIGWRRLEPRPDGFRKQRKRPKGWEKKAMKEGLIPDPANPRPDLLHNPGAVIFDVPSATISGKGEESS